jgi:hypothetical protein
MLEENRHFDVVVREGKIPCADCGVVFLRNETLITRVVCQRDAVNVIVLSQSHGPLPEILYIGLRARVADLPMDRGDNRGPDWRRIRVRACDIDGLLGLSISCSMHCRRRDCGLILSVAMFGTRCDNPRAWGNFEILAGCCRV